MKRVDRRRSARRRRALLIVGLSFALGALSAMALTWRLAESEPAPMTTMRATEAEIAALEAEMAAHEELAAPAAQPQFRAAPLPKPAATTGSDPDDRDVAILRRRDLKLPVDGIDDDDLIDAFRDSRNGRSHQAIDIMAARGTPVLSVEDGRVAKLFDSQQGGLSVYVFDPSGTYCYYYAHLDRYADGLEEGQTVTRGQVIGTVGSTGNAAENAPHLHFVIFRLGSERQWWKGTPINPYLVLK